MQRREDQHLMQELLASVSRRELKIKESGQMWSLEWRSRGAADNAV